MSKTIIGPLVGLVIMLLEALGFNIPESAGGEITSGIIVAISTVSLIYGIFKNHKKPTITKA